MEKISVVMPVYNSGRYVTKAVQSILNQTYTNFELLIIDDGSEENIVEIIQNIPNERIRFFKRNHEGIAAQRNFALSKAEGKYIANMDSDDISHPNRFQEQVEFIKKHQVDVVGTNYYRIDENDNILYHKKFPEKYEDIKFMMPIMPSLLHTSMFAYKSIFQRVGEYNVDLSPAEDYELYLRMLEKGIKIYNIQKPLLYYRIWNGSAGEKFSAAQSAVIISYSAKYFDKKIKSTDIKADLAKILYQRAIFEYYNGDLNKSRLYFLKSIVGNPALAIEIVRYIPLLLLWNKFIYYLRRKRILYKISIYMNRNFNIDFFKPY